MKRFFRFKYPKLTLLILISIIAYGMFSNPDVAGAVASLGNLSYLGVLIAGMFFSFGFITPIAVGFFVTAAPGNILLAAIIGGLGATLSDLLIFIFFRFSFKEEFARLSKTTAIKELSTLMDKELGHKIKVYFMYAFAGLIIASPLPDEAGVLMLSGLSKIKASRLAIISFIFNTLGILVMLLI
jgi:hypothetical protein